jgi:hypothetical protein
MDLPSAEQRQDLVAGLLQPQPTLHLTRMLARHRNGPVVSEEVGRVQHVHVQRVALDPLAAVEEPAKQPDRLGDLDAAGVFDRVDRARLIRDWADAADARRDVRRLAKRTAAEESLEEARRLEDPQLDVLDLAVDQPHRHCPLALDAREVVGLDRAACRGQLSLRNFSTLKVASARSTAGCSTPSAPTHQRLSDGTFGCSFGPKQP